MDPNVFKKRGQYYYEMTIGDSVYSASPKAVTAARKLGQPVTLVFNEVSIAVTGSDDPKAVAETCLKLQSSEWERKRSPDVAAQVKAERARETALDQQALDQLVGVNLGDAISKGAGAIVGWFKDYVAVAWEQGINHRSAEVAAALTEAGYKAQENSSNSQRYKDQSIFSRYVVGYALKEMERGLAPFRTSFYRVCDEFDAVKRSNSIPVMRPLSLKKGP